MRPVAYIFITIACAAAVGVGVYLWQTRAARPEPTPAATAPAPVTAPAPEQTTSAPIVTRRPDSADSARMLDYSSQFQGASDLAAFAEAMYPLAKQADDAAQFWLFRALWRCGFYYDDVFEAGHTANGRSELSVEQVLQREAKDRHVAVDEVLRLQQQCSRLRQGDASRFGDAHEWLRQASQSGQPLAQIWMANELAGTGGAESSQAKALAIAALRSGDAEVIRSAEVVALRLARGESAREQQEWVWTIAGCKRGADCGPSAEWVRNLCARDKHCESYESGLDIIRRQTGPQFAELEEAAQQLSSRIDAQRWDELGL